MNFGDIWEVFGITTSFNGWTMGIIIMLLIGLLGGYSLMASQVKLVKKEFWQWSDTLKCSFFAFFFSSLSTVQSFVSISISINSVSMFCRSPSKLLFNSVNADTSLDCVRRANVLIFLMLDVFIVCKSSYCLRLVVLPVLFELLTPRQARHYANQFNATMVYAISTAKCKLE